MQHRGIPPRDAYHDLSNGGVASHDESISSSSGLRRWQIALLVFTLAMGMWAAVQRVGLAPHDVLLVYAISGYAVMQRRWERDRGTLLGESDDVGKQLRFRDFVCEHHQLLSCVVKVRGRSRQENFLAVGVSTLFLLYWKAIFRQKIQMGSLQALAPTAFCLASLSVAQALACELGRLDTSRVCRRPPSQGLKASLWTLLVSKGVQQVMRRIIRFLARRTAAEHAQSGWLEVLQLQWRVIQGLAIGFMWLCVMLFLLEGACPSLPSPSPLVALAIDGRSPHLAPHCAGRTWIKLMSNWLVNMGFSFVVMDTALVYVRYNLYLALPPHLFKSRREL